jgi:hypothetical protein
MGLVAPPLVWQLLQPLGDELMDDTMSWVFVASRAPTIADPVQAVVV